ncbi:uncharacterized protein LOC143238141 isoform X2 [Tachypleus tridentatus]|uniref:uncharacterized protein LOC143238141 isoform X2 n=1 Tax=Tachypleus tridentatus TaxID=6853 RepID=UPI003FD35396
MDKESIHSGHFMVSEIDEEEDSPAILTVYESADINTASVASRQVKVRGYNFNEACKETSKNYCFASRSSHSIEIDASLTKLFDCMTLAYCGKLTSPRWKTFKGSKFRVKEKIRLNNIIWRAWHIQFILRCKPVVCQFASHSEIDAHNRPEAVVMEGKYWRRKLTSVKSEYMKWRLFFKQIDKTQKHEKYDICLESEDDCSREGEKFESLAFDDNLLMECSDTLFSSLHYNQLFDLPNSKEFVKAGNADFIQPGLSQLRPSIDDIMDTLEPLSDFFTNNDISLNSSDNSSTNQPQKFPMSLTSNKDQSQFTLGEFQLLTSSHSELSGSKFVANDAAHNILEMFPSENYQIPVVSSTTCFSSDPPNSALELIHDINQITEQKSHLEDPLPGFTSVVSFPHGPQLVSSAYVPPLHMSSRCSQQGTTLTPSVESLAYNNTPQSLQNLGLPSSTLTLKELSLAQHSFDDKTVVLAEMTSLHSQSSSTKPIAKLLNKMDDQCVTKPIKSNHSDCTQAQSSMKTEVLNTSAIGNIHQEASFANPEPLLSSIVSTNVTFSYPIAAQNELLTSSNMEMFFT